MKKNHTQTVRKVVGQRGQLYIGIIIQGGEGFVRTRHNNKINNQKIQTVNYITENK